MGFLQRATSARTMKEDRATSTTGQKDEKMESQRRFMGTNSDRSVGAHGKAAGKRPSTSHGTDRRKRSPHEGSTEPRGVKEQPPTCLEDLQKSGHVVEYKDGLDTFRFPTPSPHMSSMPRSATTVTFPHSPSQLQSESPAIGVALGSPSNAPPSWGRSFTADHIFSRMPQPPSRTPPPPASRPTEPVAAVNSSPDARKKKSSWKTIRTVFRWTSKPAAPAPQLADLSQPYSEVREAAPPTPFIKELAPSEAPSLDLPRPGANKKQHARIHSGSSLGTMAPPRSGSRLESRSPGLRSSLMPNLRGKLRAQRGSMTPEPPRLTAGWGSPSLRKMNDIRHDSPIANNDHYPSPQPRIPRLDVNFEKPEFERYSVMFEKLLSNESRPSLLERRQSRVQRRKPEKRIGDIKIGERLEVVTQSPGTPKRSMTSPHLTKRLSIRVDSDNRHEADGEQPSTAVHRPRHLQRASTAPLNTTSPLATVVTRGRKVTLESSPESDESALFSESSLPSTPATVTTCTDSSSVRREWQEAEPAFDMVTSNHSQSNVADSTHTSNQYPRVTSPADFERQIVQVSVARQVSVSQARSRVQRAVSSDNFKRPIRPRVVELTKNRKSEVGLLESACEEDESPVPLRESSKSGSEIAHEAPESTEKEGSTPKHTHIKAPMGPFPDPLKLNPPTPMVATFAESAKK